MLVSWIMEDPLYNRISRFDRLRDLHGISFPVEDVSQTAM